MRRATICRCSTSAADRHPECRCAACALIRSRTGAVARNMITSGPMIVKCASAGMNRLKHLLPASPSAITPRTVRKDAGDAAPARPGRDARRRRRSRAERTAEMAASRPPTSTKVSIRRSSLLVGRERLGGDGAQASRTMRREMLADDGGVERALVREVVVDHRLVDAGAAGDAVDGGGGEARARRTRRRRRRGCGCGCRGRGRAGASRHRGLIN